MLQEKAGEIAGKIWETLNENGEMSGKDLKKAVVCPKGSRFITAGLGIGFFFAEQPTQSEKELYLGLGWLLREDKIVCTATDKDYNFSLK